MTSFYLKDIAEITDEFKRFENQDRSFSINVVENPNEGNRIWIGAVLDGVSSGNGKEASAIAANAALAEVWKWISKLHEGAICSSNDRASFAAKMLKEVILAADVAVAQHPGYYTTLSVAVVMGEEVFAANIGDSPIYLIRQSSDQDTELCEMFMCHNEAGRLLREGAITEQQAISGTEKNALNRAIGDGIDERDIPVFREELGQNNIFLMGSDGALSVLPRCRLKILGSEIMRNDDSMYLFCRRLYQEVYAVENATDNFTVTAAKIGLG